MYLQFVAEAKLKALEEAQEAEEQGRSPPGGKSVRDLEEDLTVDIEPDEVFFCFLSKNLSRNVEYESNPEHISRLWMGNE